MDNAKDYTLRGRVQTIFDIYTACYFDQLEEIKKYEEENIKNKKKKMLNNYSLENNEEYEYRYINFLKDKENDDLKKYYEIVFEKENEYILVKNYTSVINANNEEKINILLANKEVPAGNIEIQIKGKQTYIIPCKYSNDIISCYSPLLEKGMYELRVFINKELIYFKILKPIFKLSSCEKSVTLHVIEDFDHGSKKKIIKNKYTLNMNNNNNYTNKELLKLYSSVYKEYGKYFDKRDGQLYVNNNYKLDKTDQINFYNFLENYRNEFVNNSFKNLSYKEIFNKMNNICNIGINNVNDINFISPLNFNEYIEQNRIPILYKKILYDHCNYENKHIIMQFHSSIYEYDPFKLLSVHIFTKEELKDGYVIFAFNLIPLLKNPKEKMAFFNKKNVNNVFFNVFYNKQQEQENTNIKTHNINNYLSTLLTFSSNETNFADLRMWKYRETITCRKNKDAKNFYINKKNITNDIECIIPPELINNKNVFKKYSEGIKISDNISIFFEKWQENILPIKKFLNNINYEIPYKKLIELCSFIKDINDDYFLFKDLDCKEQNSNKNESNIENIMEHLYNNFVTFVVVINDKIYTSVTPINKLLLLFIINFWLYFVDLQKDII